VTGDQRTTGAANDLSQGPRDQSRQAALGEALRRATEEDPAFASSLAYAVSRAHSQNFTDSPITQSVDIQGGNTGDIAVGGHVAKGRRVHIGDRIVNKMKASRSLQVVTVLVGVAVVFATGAVVTVKIVGDHQSVAGTAISTENGKQSLGANQPAAVSPNGTKLTSSDICNQFSIAQAQYMMDLSPGQGKVTCVNTALSALGRGTLAEASYNVTGSILSSSEADTLRVTSIRVDFYNDTNPSSPSFTAAGNYGSFRQQAGVQTDEMMHTAKGVQLKCTPVDNPNRFEFMCLVGGLGGIDVYLSAIPTGQYANTIQPQEVEERLAVNVALLVEPSGH
jgi:hypothetical protein